MLHCLLIPAAALTAIYVGGLVLVLISDVFRKPSFPDNGAVGSINLSYIWIFAALASGALAYMNLRSRSDKMRPSVKMSRSAEMPWYSERPLYADMPSVEGRQSAEGMPLPAEARPPRFGGNRPCANEAGPPAGIWRIVLGALSLLIIGVILIAILNYGSRLCFHIARSQWFKKYNLLLFYGCVFAPFQIVLRPARIMRLNWKRLTEIWIKSPTYPAVALGAIGFIGQTKLAQADIIGTGVALGYVNGSWIIVSYLIAIAALVIAGMACKIGRSCTKDDNTNSPWAVFMIAFCNSWLSSVIIGALTCEGVLLAYLQFRHLGF